MGLKRVKLASRIGEIFRKRLGLSRRQMGKCAPKGSEFRARLCACLDRDNFSDRLTAFCKEGTFVSVANAVDKVCEPANSKADFCK